KPVRASGRDRQLHQTRLRRGRDQRKALRQRVRVAVLQQRRDKSVGQVRWEPQAVGFLFLFAALVGVLHDDLAARAVDRQVERQRKGRALLHQMVADQAKLPLLGKDRRLVEIGTA